ncbi:MAG: T9SS type A sorting domain-containing protein [Ignavibacteria bacterium]
MTIGSGTYKVFYKVSAVNNSYKESVLSDYSWANYDPRMQKISNEKYDYSLSECYPNPFNPTTKIKYTVGSKQNAESEKQFVTLKVYDLLGREIATLVNEPKQAGEDEIEFDASKYNLPSGVYLYELRSGSFKSAKKFVLMK